jgi:uncharacterized protein YeaO (DUF488 family)
VAAQAGTDIKMTSQVHKTLEKKGLVEREVDPADTRARRLRVTRRGRTAFRPQGARVAPVLLRRQASPAPMPEAPLSTTPREPATMGVDIQVKRIYEAPERDDGYRVLVDRVWPRGVSRDRAQLDEWARELAPSDELRRWFGHDPDRFEEFRSRYRDELKGQRKRVSQLRRRAKDGPLTILYSARDREHNNAIVLAERVRGS